MLSDDHFEALRALRNEAKKLTVTATEYAGAASLVHMAFDRSIKTRLSSREEASLRKLRSVK